MDNQKAIGELKERINLIDKNYQGSVQEYKGVLELAISALEKQMPKNPEKSSMATICPECSHAIKRCYGFCPGCGQAIDWD